MADCIDWKAIKTEYITTNTSYRKLSAKYGVTYNVIGERSRHEGWLEERDQYRATTVSKTIEEISNQEVNRAARLQTVTDKMLDKIEAIVDSVKPEEWDARSLRAISAALKDIKEIQGIRSDLDQQEQRARIANLRKSAEAEENADKEITVTIAGDLEEYSR